MNELGWGLQITALGMGLVFAMLALLWGLLTLVLRLDAAPSEPSLEPEAPAAEPPATQALPGPGLDPAVVAAITAAVMAHRQLMRTRAAPAMRTHWPGTLLHASRWVAAGRTRQNQSWRRTR